MICNIYFGETNYERKEKFRNQDISLEIENLILIFTIVS